MTSPVAHDFDPEKLEAIRLEELGTLVSELLIGITM